VALLALVGWLALGGTLLRKIIHQDFAQQLLPGEISVERSMKPYL
jgi:hypothetical protein